MTQHAYYPILTPGEKEKFADYLERHANDSERLISTVAGEGEQPPLDALELAKVLRKQIDAEKLVARMLRGDRLRTS